MSELPSIAAHDASPATAANRPFLSRIAYRADDYASLRAALLAHLAEAFPEWNPGLAANTGERDLAVAFAELFAYTGEVLGFYQDCYANEAFLRTATLPGSVMDLAALVDYRVPAGAGAETLQLFLAKPGMRGLVPRGYRVETKAVGATPALSFETAHDLACDAARNALRLVGWNRTARRLNATGLPRESRLALDQGYSGLKAGSWVVFRAPGVGARAVRLGAVTTEDGTRVIHWNPAALPAGANLALADLVILGKPKQVMRVRDAERADELAAGAHAARVANPGLFETVDTILIQSGPMLAPARVLSIAGDLIAWDRPLPMTVRRSETRIYTGGNDGFAFGGGPYRVGATMVRSDNPYGTRARAGDHLVLYGSGGGDVALVTHASVGENEYTLATPLTRTFRQGATFFRVRLASPDGGGSASSSSRLAPARLSATQRSLALDRAYEGLKPGVLVVVSDGVASRVHQVRAVTLDADGRTVLGLRRTLGTAFRTATTTVHGPFELTMRPRGHDRADASTPAGQAALALDGTVAGLAPGAYVVVEGGGHAEGARILAVTHGAGRTTLALQAPLAHAYPLADTAVHANVARVTQGAAVAAQTLGSGDASRPGQELLLRRSPTTHVHDPSAPRGARSTLELFVDDVRWTAVESLADSGPADRHYAEWVDDEGVTHVRFGDGRHGAAPASGRDNIRARYRTGLGARGNVAAGAISEMAEPLAFLDRTRNPLPASGGADREPVARTKRMAPAAVRTLERAVSLADHAELALTHAGIAKARAAWGAEGAARGARSVVLTVASEGGAALSPPVAASLRAFMETRRAPGLRLVVRDYAPLPVRLALEVGVARDVLRAETLARVRQALGNGVADDGAPGLFHFDRRDLGGDLFLSDVYAAAERVRGVDHVRVTAFHPEGSAWPAGTVLDRVRVPDHALATGGDPSRASVGRLHVVGGGGIE